MVPWASVPLASHSPTLPLTGAAFPTQSSGSHLAMMPHPERAYLGWQVPVKTTAIDPQGAGPWLQLFQNCRAFLAEAKTTTKA